MSDASRRFFLGAVRRRRPDWEQFLVVPQAPRHYGEKAAEDWRQSKLAEQSERADKLPFVSYLHEVAVIDDLGAVRMQIVAASDALPDRLQPAIGLMEFLQTPLCGLDPIPGAPSQQDLGVRWFGFDIREVLHTAAVSVLGARQYVPPRTWCFPPFAPAPCVDPYEAWVPSTMRNMFDVYALCDYLGIPSGPDIKTQAVPQAQLAMALSFAGGFFTRQS